MILTLETKNQGMEEEKKTVEEKHALLTNQIRQAFQLENDNLNGQFQKLKGDLVELSSFTSQKDEMSMQLSQIKSLLDKKEIDYRETIHGLERKVLQDKVQGGVTLESNEKRDVAEGQRGRCKLPKGGRPANGRNHQKSNSRKHVYLRTTQENESQNDRVYH